MPEPSPHGAPRPLRHLSLLALALLAALSGVQPARAVPLDRLISPRPAHWVLDTTGTLSPLDVARLDARVEAARQRTGGEIAVVVIDSTDGQPSRDYATALANRWLIGDQAKRNGILILLAKNDRRAEIALGKGIDGERETAIAEDIMERSMVPRFKAGDYSGGLYAAVEGAAERILDDRGDTPPAPLSPITPPSQPESGGAFSRFQIETVRDHEQFWGVTGSLLILGCCVAFLLSRHPRKCPKCREPMVWLDATHEPVYLDDGQEKEQELDSIDYKVWLCTACHTVDVRSAGRFLSPYRSCSSCGFRTMWVESAPLVAATQMLPGLVELTERCRHCSHVRSYRQSTPRLATQAAGFAAAASRSGGSTRSGGGGSFRGGGASGSW